jgi:hypothetical protein
MDITRLQYPLFQAFNDDGDPLVGGWLHTYVGGTTTRKTTYSDKTLTTPNSNPIELDGRGEAQIYFLGTVKLILQDAALALIWTTDNVAGYGTFQAENGTEINEFSTDGTLSGDSDDAVPTEKAVKKYSDSGIQTMFFKTLNVPTLTSPVINTGISGSAFLDEDAMGSNAADKVASQQSIKAYADSRGFISRGDPAAYDFTLGDFTTDSTWNDLDLSGIVTAGAKAVLIYIRLVDDNANQEFAFRESGNTETYNKGALRTQVGGLTIDSDFIIPYNANEKVEYMAVNPPGGFTAINVLVKGWWI